jgi:DNA repair photolyase
VPAPSRVPFQWTINPYRGCTHGCIYCFARNTHTYLDLDAGRDFDTQIVVKTNIAEVLRRELARPGWTREHVAMGTNTDPYQRAEGRYRLMPDVVTALTRSGTPFSILTKGTLLSRDLPLLADAGSRVKVGISISLALLDPELHTTLEPGTPTPQARLNLIRRVRAAGLPCGVLVAPILPYLTDSDEQLQRLVGELSAAGATSISGIALHLRPGARQWFFGWLHREHPDLVPAYERLYARSANAAKGYVTDLQRRLGRITAGVQPVRR